LVGFLDPIERKGSLAPVVSPSTVKARALFERRWRSQQQEKKQKKERQEEKEEQEEKHAVVA
jgi:hypothetical protein